MTHEAVAKKQRQVEMDREMDLDDYENGLKDLWVYMLILIVYKIKYFQIIKIQY